MPALDAPPDLPGFTPAPPLPNVLDMPIAEEVPPLPGFTADSMAGQPDLESYPIQDHDPSDYVESFPIGEDGRALGAGERRYTGSKIP
ncbi:hypothetical protein JKG68_02400 [Microvirga aerilata]|uniref:Uncharacterized protein n=1 Tax=Microvirga aerilata TaxID=670292 RepID=A0A937CY12_9HYPH|nr:hypothetical protein [Microvirga aerilata]MBL0402811.1 hypothetical protein [Microvirga aerilata]